MHLPSPLEATCKYLTQNEQSGGIQGNVVFWDTILYNAITVCMLTDSVSLNVLGIISLLHFLIT